MNMFKDLRIKNNVNVKELANLLNISVQAYYKYENGMSEPSINSLILLANFYNISLDYLLGRQYNNPVGYIPDDDKDLIKDILLLDDNQKTNVKGYVKGLMSGNKNMD